VQLLLVHEQVKAAAASAAAVVPLTLKANTQLLLDLKLVVMIKVSTV
jgi:hypothetical protein